MILYRICLLITCMVGSLSLARATVSAREEVFNQLRERFNQNSIGSIDPAIRIDSMLLHLQADGNWTDIAYEEQTPSRWSAATHWDRSLLMAQLYRSEQSVYFKKAALKEKVLQAIGWWNHNLPVSRNYWWNAIGLPLKIGESFLLLDNDLPAAQRTAGIGLMKLGIKPDFYDYHGPATGQNQIWLATVHLMTGVLEKDERQLNRAFRAIYEEIKITTEEGIQPDYSFHQHGQMLYAGGYGLAFTRNLAQLILLAQDTPYQFPADKLAIFSAYVLDGQQWMMRGQVFDHSTVGREIARPLSVNATTKDGLPALTEQLSRIKTPRQDEFRRMAARVKGKNGIRLSGNRHFWRSDMMAHHRQGYYSSLKMTSERLLSGESGNGENLKGYYMGHGVQLLYRSGAEYKDIFPVWDWRRIPGTLCEQSDAALPLFDWGKGARGTTDFAGGASDGEYGVAAYDYQYTHIKARKAWLHFDEEIVCLGAAISSGTDKTLFQSINQCHVNGPVFTATAQTPAAETGTGTHLLRRPQWVWHDSIAYIFPDTEKVFLRNDVQTGSWRSINNNSFYPDGTVNHQVFSVWLDMGRQVKEGSYYYIIRPAVSAAAMEHYRNPVVLLRNDSIIQAVHHTTLDMVQAAFYQPATLNDGAGITISVDKPVLLMAKKQPGALVFTLSNPENEALDVKIRINQKVSCSTCTWSAKDKLSTIAVTLPSGDMAGQSVTVHTRKP
jgi:chondroitin AC lyase